MARRAKFYLRFWASQPYTLLVSLSVPNTKRRMILLRTSTVVAVLIAALTACGSRETTPPPAQVRTETPLERGRYLVEGLMDCFGCHSDVDWKAPGAPIVAGRKGSGVIFPEEGLPFKITAPNITPDAEAGLANWTDEEIGRAIRNGIGKDGRVLFPAMPYMSYRAISDEDLAAVITYLRSIPAVRNTPPKSPLPPPVQKSLMAPPPVTSVPASDVSTPEKRGAYLYALGACTACHTPLDPKKGPRFDIAQGGGFVMKGAWGEVAFPPTLRPIHQVFPTTMRLSS